MKKIDLKKVKKKVSHLGSDLGKKDCPQLYAFFADAEWVDGKETSEREGGSLWVQARGGVLHCVLKEPGQALRMVIEAPSLAALLGTLEAALASEGSMWEVDPYSKPVQKKKRN